MNQKFWVFLINSLYFQMIQMWKLSTKVNIMVADVLVPNRHQDISIHNVDSRITAVLTTGFHNLSIKLLPLTDEKPWSHNHCWFHNEGFNFNLRFNLHDDSIKWKHFPRNWPFVRKIHQSPVNSPHKGQWHIALMFSLICAWINGWVNNGEAGDLRCHRLHYDVIVMCWFHNEWFHFNLRFNLKKI